MKHQGHPWRSRTSHNPLKIGPCEHELWVIKGCRAFRYQITVGGRAAKFHLEDCGTRQRWYSNENP